MAWSWLQSTSASTASGTTLATTFTTANLTAASKMVCVVATSAGVVETTNSVAATGSVAFTKLATISGSTGGNIELTLWVLDTTAGLQGTKPTVTATFSAATGASILVQEVSGLTAGNTSAILDGTAGTVQQTTAATQAQPSYSSTASNEYLVACFGDTGGPETYTVPGAYTADTGGVNNNADADIVIAYKNSTNGAESGTWSFSGTFSGAAYIVVAIKVPAAAGAGASPQAVPGRSWLRRFHHPQQALSPFVAAAAPVSGPPVYPLRGPVAARFPSLLRGGRTAGRQGTFAQAGPPVTALRGPVGVGQRQPPPPAGSAAGSTGLFAQAGPPVTPLRGPVAARQPLPPRGRTASSRGTRAQTGAPVYPAHGPVRTRPQPPPRGRCAGRQGTFTAVVPQAGPPAYPLQGPVRTRPQPPPRGRCASSRGTFAQPGPPVTPLRGPVAARKPSQLQGGRCRWNAGTYTFVGIQSGPPVYPAHGPVRTRQPLPPRGRCAGNRGTFAQAGPQVTPLQRPARSRVPHRTRGGHMSGSPGAPVFVPPFTIGRLTAATAASGSLGAGDKAAGLLTGGTAPLGATTATDV
jgi:hypothetical protein